MASQEEKEKQPLQHTLDEAATTTATETNTALVFSHYQNGTPQSSPRKSNKKRLSKTQEITQKVDSFIETLDWEWLEEQSIIFDQLSNFVETLVGQKLQMGSPKVSMERSN